jgi:hypothetical protein
MPRNLNEKLYVYEFGFWWRILASIAGDMAMSKQSRDILTEFILIIGTEERLLM